MALFLEYSSHEGKPVRSVINEPQAVLLVTARESQN